LVGIGFAAMKKLATTIEVIEHLGGNDEVAAMIENTHYKAVANWRYFGIFPANTYVVLKKELRKHRFSAPDELWNMKRRTTTR
jgi:hypothetical protein